MSFQGKRVYLQQIIRIILFSVVIIEKQCLLLMKAIVIILNIDFFCYRTVAGIMKYMDVFHPVGCTKNAHSLKLTGSILNITFNVMTRRVSYRKVANNIAPGKLVNPVRRLSSAPDPQIKKHQICLIKKKRPLNDIHTSGKSPIWCLV